MSMRLADFIRAEIEPIIQDWEEFAKTILHAGQMGKTGLRDHAREMLLEIADDLDSIQSESEQAAKSKGLEAEDDEEGLCTLVQKADQAMFQSKTAIRYTAMSANR